MKTLSRFLLSFLFLLFGLVFLLQTPIVKNKIKKFIVSCAKKKGIYLAISKLDGNLPFEWKARDVCLEYKDHLFYFEILRFRPAILPLFQKKLKIDHCKIDKGLWEGREFKINASFCIFLNDEDRIKVSHFYLESKDSFLTGYGKISSKKGFEEGKFSFLLREGRDFSSYFAGASCFGEGVLKNHLFLSKGFVKNFQIGENPFCVSTYHLEIEKIEENWKGKASIIGGIPEFLMEIQTDLFYNPSSSVVSIKDFSLSAPDLFLQGKGMIDLNSSQYEGALSLKAMDLEKVSPFLPHTKISGALKMELAASYSQHLNLDFEIQGKDLLLEEWNCKNFELQTSYFDLLGTPKGKFFLEALKISNPSLEVKEFRISSDSALDSSCFDLFAQGNLQEAFEVSARGNWRFLKEKLELKVEEFSGKALENSFSLLYPFIVQAQKKQVTLQDFSLQFGKGRLYSDIQLGKSSALIKLKGEEFPLEWIPFPNPFLTMSGTAAFDLNLQGREQELQGTLNIAVKRALLFAEGRQSPTVTKGSVQIHMNGTNAQIHGELKAKGKQLCQFSATLPFHYTHSPFSFTLLEDVPFSGELLVEGNMEEVLHFINIGHQRVEGWLSAKMHISKTLSKPRLVGEFEIADGLYENYYSGTVLKKISARGTIQKQKILLSEFSAIDGKAGIAKGHGEILLSHRYKFPYSLSAKLNQFETVTFDTLKGNFSGDITLFGNQTGAIAKGSLLVEEATFKIPDHLPTSLPEIPLTFINPPEKFSSFRKKSPLNSPLKLDINLEVPGKAFVEGKGLSAELKGQLHLSGNFLDLRTKGKLELIHGDYLFSGKVFDLTQGELIFNDLPTPSSYLSLSGNCQLPELSVTAILRGPLTSPTLSFQSSPPMATSSILSQILFNQDVSEISAIEALQLAQTILSLSGSTAPDVLGKIRKTLGIDRLTLISSENDPGKLSLQIGKYLMRGVLLTLSQGAESRNVSVEVDLKKGIRFQAEINEDQQGKFSLKWHHHY